MTEFTLQKLYQTYMSVHKYVVKQGNTWIDCTMGHRSEYLLHVLALERIDLLKDRVGFDRVTVLSL